MQLIRVIPMGILADRYEAVEIGASTAAEALEGWSRQVCPVGRIPQLLQVLNFETEDELRAPTDATELYIYPCMYGGGGLARYAGIILGAAIFAASIVASGGMTAALASTFGAAALVSGATMMLMGIVNLFMPQPSLSKENDPEASKYIGAGGNTAKIGTPIGMGGGRMLLGGHYLSIQVNAQDLVYGTYPTVPPT